MIREMTIQVCEKAAQLVDKGWVQGTNALDEAGRITDFFDPGAVRFCAVGAIARAARQVSDFEHYDRLIRLIRKHELPDIFLIVWNDEPGRTKEEVRDLFLRVAERLRREGDDS